MPHKRKRDHLPSNIVERNQREVPSDFNLEVNKKKRSFTIKYSGHKSNGNRYIISASPDFNLQLNMNLLRNDVGLSNLNPPIGMMFIKTEKKPTTAIKRVNCR